MRLNANDIRNFSFRKVMRGLDPEEVQAFLDTVAEQTGQREGELAESRARIEDQRRDALPVSEHGWMYRNDIARLLKVDRGLINLWVHRARRQLADAGILEVGELVQRRQGAEQLRIGVPRLEVHEGA